MFSLHNNEGLEGHLPQAARTAMRGGTYVQCMGPMYVPGREKSVR
jgi:hypothetical protein